MAVVINELKEHKRGLNKEALKFCRLIAEGHTQHEAYVASYPTAKDWDEGVVRSAGHRLMQRPLVQEKVEELKLMRIARMAKLRAESREFIADVFMEGLDLLREGIDMAREMQDYQVMINASDKMSSAADRMGKFLGLNVAPAEGNGDDKKLDDLTDAELIRLVESQSRSDDTSGRAITSEVSAA